MGKRQLRRTVSVSPKTYLQLKYLREMTGRTCSSMVDELVDGLARGVGCELPEEWCRERMVELVDDVQSRRQSERRSRTIQMSDAAIRSRTSRATAEQRARMVAQYRAAMGMAEKAFG